MGSSVCGKELQRTSYSMAGHIFTISSSELSNHTYFQLSQTVCIFRRNVAHFVRFLPLKVIFLFAHLLKFLELPSPACPSGFPSVPALGFVVLRPVVSGPVPLDSPGGVPAGRV